MNTPQKQQSHHLEPVNFHGDTIFVVEHQGEPFVPLRPIVEATGLDWKSQYRRISSNRERWSCVVMMTTQLPGDTQNRQVVTIPLHKLSGFLATIDARRVKKELRDKVIAYQNECDDALHRYWTTGHAANPRCASPSPTLALPSLADLAGQFQHTALALNSPELTDTQRWELAGKIAAALFGVDAAGLLGQREAETYRANLRATFVRPHEAPTRTISLIELGPHGLEFSVHLRYYFISACCRVEAGTAGSEETMFRLFREWFQRAFDHEPPSIEMFKASMSESFRRISLAGKPWYLGVAPFNDSNVAMTEVSHG